MAEMQTSDSGSHKKGSKKVRTKKMSTRRAGWRSVHPGLPADHLLYAGHDDE